MAIKRRILVTGATGFLGTHLLSRLDGGQVRVLARAGQKSFSAAQLETGIEVMTGDVTDGVSLERSLQGISQVYHLAGLVSRNPDDAEKMYRVHVEGTRLLGEAALRAGIERIMVASSSGTIAVGNDPERVFTENDGYATAVVSNWPYYLSKIYQEQIALRLVTDHKMDVVVVSPSLLLGPGDTRLSSTGDVAKFLSRSIPVVPPGGLSFVDVRDAADALVLAMQRGQAGERYLVGGPNWTFERFFGRLERLSKVPAPKLKLPRRAALWGASLMETIAKWQGRSPDVDPISVEMGHCYWYLDAAKATRVLGFTARDPQETLLDTIKDLRSRTPHQAFALSVAS